MHKNVLNASPVIVDYMRSLREVYITSIIEAVNGSAQEPTVKVKRDVGGRMYKMLDKRLER